MEYSYNPKGVCPSEISFNLEDDIVSSIIFKGGCKGNLSALSKLLNGKTSEEIIDLFEGHLCGIRKTSCMDQLVKALKETQ
jgi:uncharacterized protein (TIGR03905 family)